MTGIRIIGETMDMLIGRMCPKAQKSDKGGKLKITTVADLSLRVLLPPSLEQLVCRPHMRPPRLNSSWHLTT